MHLWGLLNLKHYIPFSCATCVIAITKKPSRGSGWGVREMLPGRRLTALGVLCLRWMEFTSRRKRLACLMEPWEAKYHRSPTPPSPRVIPSNELTIPGLRKFRKVVFVEYNKPSILATLQLLTNPVYWQHCSS